MTKVSKAQKRRPAKPSKPRRRKLSPEVLKRRREERERHRVQRNESVPQLLYTRQQSGAALGVSISTIIRLENEKKIRKVRLRGETGQIFNPVEDIEALASEAGVVDASKVGT